MEKKERVSINGRSGDEMGFVILEDCGVVVTRENFSIGKWTEVGIRRETNRDAGNDSSSHQGFLETNPNEMGVEDSGPCGRCHLTLNAAGDRENKFELDWDRISLFDGLETDVEHQPCRRARSDSALLMGLLKSCQDYVSVRTCSVLFKAGGDTASANAALIVTLSFPLLLKGEPGRRSILTSHRPENFNKPLPPALQLLLSVIRSDWENLDALMRKMEEPTPSEPSPSSQGRRSTFFPHKLSLEDLYLRIPGSSNAYRDSEDPPKVDQPPECHLVRLPKEILAERIAPFLRARSLDALRCSCKFLHDTMRAAVPGLRLQLYRHQVNSLSWMRMRECRSMWEGDCLETTTTTTSSSSPISQCPDGDMHRAVTGGFTVLLRQRPDSSSSLLDTATIRIHQYSGREITKDEMASLPRSVARGGLLCDDPGLGKTITVLSLILQTCGLSTDREFRTRNDASSEGIFRTYWSETITSEFRIPLMNKLVNDLCRGDRGRGYFPTDQLRKAIYRDAYRDDFESFESDVENALSYYSPDDSAKSGSRRLVSEFRSLVGDLKGRQIRSAKKTYSNASARPNSRVAAMIERQSRQTLIDKLVPSSGTLLVIPSVLMEHWQTQIEMHVNLCYFTRKTPLVFEYGKKDSDMSVDKATILCQLNKTHSPTVFLDKAGTRPLPPAEFLSMFRIVITTNQRFKNEWNNGSFQGEIERESSCKDVPSYLDCAYGKSAEACPLLKVHWLRLVVDEGHSMGRGKQNATIQFASWISAERRWAMTGTPTKQTTTQLNQVKALMNFIGHDFFTARLQGDKHWRNSITRPWREGCLGSFFRLRSLFSLLMKRHTKLDIAELPPPLFLKTVVPMSFMEATTYNTLVCGVQSNLLLTSMKGKTSGLQDSLLHRSQARFAREALANIRRVCVGWSRVIPTVTYSSFLETLELLESHGIEQTRIEALRRYMVTRADEELASCGCCALQLSTLLLLPCCGGLICSECMDNRSTSGASTTPEGRESSTLQNCVLCDQHFNVDDFQRLQPGFFLNWKSNLKLTASKKGTSPRRIEIEPGTEISGPSPQGNVSDQILIRPPQARRRTRKFGDGHECEYDRLAADGKCILCLEEHNSCNLINEQSRCKICHRVSEKCPDDESKASFVAAKLTQLRGQDDRPLKAIIFSQFRKALDVVGDRLLKTFGTGCVAEYWGRYRTQELHKFTYENDCFCMLLSKDGSEGLDLSFVTHIFFLEEIWDKSLEDQAIARAWRMGATGRVVAETLIAKNSVEETMQEMEAVSRGEKAGDPEISDSLLTATGKESNAKEQQTTKTHFLLRSLRLITDYHQFGQNSKVRYVHHPESENGQGGPKRKSSLPTTSRSTQLAEPKRKKVKFDLPPDGQTGHALRPLA